ncbi:hypothetical protein [Nonomuraea sp. NPDC050783]|uniref:hypothetical protein n=1 Tax=Nonomuraea sp. NPDC050783 TaxID=3154634 RepID=UPI0034650C17
MTARKTKTEAAPDNRLAVRRVGRSTIVEMCDLADPEDSVLMSAKVWVDFKSKVRSGRSHPKRDGDYVIFEIEDDSMARRRTQILSRPAPPQQHATGG